MDLSERIKGLFAVLTHGPPAYVAVRIIGAYARTDNMSYNLNSPDFQSMDLGGSHGTSSRVQVKVTHFLIQVLMLLLLMLQSKADLGLS